jgi:hypothetical protein
MSVRRIALLAAILCVGLGVWLLLRPRADVTVTLTNESARPIAWVALEHERGGERIDHLAPRASRDLRFRAAGETSFRLRVRFEDGAEYEREGGYPESGHAFRIALRDTGIAFARR